MEFKDIGSAVRGNHCAVWCLALFLYKLHAGHPLVELRVILDSVAPVLG